MASSKGTNRTDAASNAWRLTTETLRSYEMANGGWVKQKMSVDRCRWRRARVPNLPRLLASVRRLIVRIGPGPNPHPSAGRACPSIGQAAFGSAGPISYPASHIHGRVVRSEYDFDTGTVALSTKLHADTFGKRIQHDSTLAKGVLGRVTSLIG